MSGACRTIFGRLCRHFPPQSSALCGCSHGGSLGQANGAWAGRSGASRLRWGASTWQLQRGANRSTAELEVNISAFITAQNGKLKSCNWLKAADEILAYVTRFCQKTMSPTSGSGDWGQNLDQQEPRQVNYRLDGSLGVGVVEFDNSADDKFPSLSISIRSKLASVAVRYSTSDII